MVRTEVGMIPVTEDDLDVEMFLSESTTALTISTFSAVRAVSRRPNLPACKSLAVASLFHFEFYAQMAFLDTIKLKLCKKISALSQQLTWFLSMTPQ